VTGLNRLVLCPAFEIFGKRKSGRVTTLWIFLETLETNCGEIAVYFRI
jgi:hypothetical protein